MPRMESVGWSHREECMATKVYQYTRAAPRFIDVPDARKRIRRRGGGQGGTGEVLRVEMEGIVGLRLCC